MSHTPLVPKEFTPGFSLTRPPTVPVVLDRSNPIARKLKIAWLGKTPKVEYTRNGSPTKEGNPELGPYYSDLDGNGDGYTFDANFIDALTGSASVICKARYDNTSQNSNTMFGQGGNGEAEAANFTFLFSLTSSRAIRMFWEFGGGSNVIVTGPTIEAAAIGKFKTYASTRKTGATSDVKFYYEGDQIGTTSTGNTNPSGGSSATYNVGYAYSNGALFEEIDGAIEYVYVADEELSDSEIRSLTDQPYQVFKPAITSTYFYPSAAGGTVTVNLTGQSSTAQQGTPTVTGDALVSVTGQQATSGQGSLTVSIGKTVSLTGQASTAQQGTPTVQGDALVSVTGQESTAQQGAVSVSIAGAKIVNINGQASTAQQGSPTVQGNCLVSLTGQQSTAQQGAVSVVTINTVALTGQAANAAQGALSISAGCVLSLSGQGASTQQGNLSIIDGDIWTVQPNVTTSWTIQN